MPYNPTDHISVHSRPRPVRIAFLVDVRNCPVEVRNAILDFNSNLWGGRLNPIIPIENGIIPQGYWNLMSAYDPDIIYSYPALSDDLIKKIDREISPYHFVVHKIIHEDFYKYRPSIHEQFIAVDFSATPRVVPGYSREKFSFLICQNRQEWEYYPFFQTNFGIYNDQNMYQPPSELERVEIASGATPDIFLEQIAKKRRGVIYPWQFTVSDVPLRQIHDGSSCRHDCFTVVIGDSIWNWLYMWNKIFLLSTWKKNEINQFYMPKVIIENENLYPAIKELISVHAYRSGSNPPTVRFMSADIDENSLLDISKKLTDKIDAIPATKILSHDFEELRDKKPENWFAPKFPQHDYVTGNKFYLKTPRPPLRGKQQRGKWVVDFMIEYHPQKFSYTNLSYWWKLPRMHTLATCFLESGSGGGRIDGDGCLSVIAGDDKNPDLCFRIPDDRSIITLLLMQGRQPYFTDDVRYKPSPVKPIYGHIQLSDKGRYLNGFLSLLGKLFHAGSLVEHHFWRTVFEDMCAVNTHNESGVYSMVKNKFDKFVPRILSNIPTADNKRQEYITRIVDFLSRLTVRFGRHLKKPATDITFVSLMRLFDEERQAFIKMPAHQKGFESNPQRNRKDLLEALEELTASKILIQGIKPTCSRCGFQTWRSADEVKFELICDGCQFQMQIPPEAEWVYRLNSLVQDAIRHHGTFPVVWALAQILSESRESFIFRPCLELREDYEKQILAELDIACISDGKFIIGEIKTKADEFSFDEIQKLCVMARNTLPQQVIVGAFDPPYNKLADVAKEIAEKLKDLQIQIRILHPSKQLNEPEYHPYF